jgi:hypothetical protein
MVQAVHTSAGTHVAWHPPTGQACQCQQTETLLVTTRQLQGSFYPGVWYNARPHVAGCLQCNMDIITKTVYNTTLFRKLP